MSDTLKETTPQHDPKDTTVAPEAPVARPTRTIHGRLLEANLHNALLAYLDTKPHSEVRGLIDVLRNSYPVTTEIPA